MLHCSFCRWCLSWRAARSPLQPPVPFATRSATGAVCPVTRFGWEYLYANTLGSQLTKVRKPDHVADGATTFVEVAFEYDEMQRVTKMQGPGNEFGMYGYDVNSRMVWGFDETWGTWLNGSATDYASVWNFEYDAEGRLTKERLSGQTSGTETLYPLGERRVQFDVAGRRTKQSFKSESNRTGYLALDTATTYTYDSTKHWLNGIQRVGSNLEKANYEYDSNDGRLTKITYGNGARTEYVYYSAGALSKISHFANGGTLFASVAYDYDLAGNVTKATLDDALANPGDAVITYGYDDLHRLVREDCAPEGSSRQAYRYCYTYDAVGNRTAMYYWNGSTTATTTYEYSPRNELTKTTVGGNDTLLNYDLRGNLTKRGDTEYYWSFGDKLTRVYDGSMTVEYKYDLMGRRVAKRVDSGPWRWYFCDGLQVVAEGTSTTSKLSYTLSPGAVAGILTRGDGSTTYTYHFDRLGNVMAITDSNGSPYAVYTMEAFGNVLEKGTSSGYSSEHASDPQPYHLTTKEYDADIGLYYFNARWYEALSGRFISRDPASAGYAFSENSPVVFRDPTGLLSECDCGLELCCRPVEPNLNDPLRPIWEYVAEKGAKHCWVRMKSDPPGKGQDYHMFPLPVLGPPIVTHKPSPEVRAAGNKCVPVACKINSQDDCKGIRSMLSEVLQQNFYYFLRADCTATAINSLSSVGCTVTEDQLRNQLGVPTWQY